MSETVSDDTWMVERMRIGSGERIGLEGPLATIDMTAVVATWLVDSLTGGIVIYRTPKNN